MPRTVDISAHAELQIRRLTRGDELVGFHQAEDGHRDVLAHGRAECASARRPNDGKRCGARRTRRAGVELRGANRPECYGCDEGRTNKTRICCCASAKRAEALFDGTPRRFPADRLSHDRAAFFDPDVVFAFETAGGTAFLSQHIACAFCTPGLTHVHTTISRPDRNASGSPPRRPQSCRAGSRSPGDRRRPRRARTRCGAAPRRRR